MPSSSPEGPPSGPSIKGRNVRIFRPGWRFPSVSATGTTCSLSCDHCCGAYLRGMVDVSPPGALYSYGMDLWGRGGKGLLISGGCSPSGTVAFNDHTFLEARRLKEETSLALNFHTGLLEDKGADRVAGSRPDAVSLDIVADRGVARDIFHLDAGPEDFERTYGLLADRGVRVVPHILAGLRPEDTGLEARAIDLLAPFSPETAVLIAFMPTKGTPMERTEPASPRLVLRTARTMRARMDGDLYLGCMRPRGNPSLEISVLKSGFDGIVQPSTRTVEWLRSKASTIVECEECCAIPAR